MNKVFVHERISKRHPELQPKDVLAAWNSCIRNRPRYDKNPREYIGIGADSKGRLVEFVAVMNSEGDWLIYHATTPPSENAKRELGFTRR